MREPVIDSLGMGNDEPPVKRLVVNTLTNNCSYINSNHFGRRLVVTWTALSALSFFVRQMNTGRTRRAEKRVGPML
jgi:hypothetical protein